MGQVQQRVYGLPPRITSYNVCYTKLLRKNLQDGLIQDYTIEGTNGSAYWANDNHTLFFTEKDPITLRSHKTYRTKYLSTSAPELVFDETDDTYYSSVYKSRSRKYLIIVSSRNNFV